MNELERLLVWERLEVGPTVIESTRAVTPYRVVTIGPDGQEKVAEIEHVFRYEGPTLDAKDPVCVNLCAIAGAQIALNYGLFARQIVFRGAFEEADKVFLREMADNTCTEIYVLKLQHENPFLTGPKIPWVKRDSYLQADLVFPDPEPALRRERWSGNPDHVCVLSSGGKDSLLSQGLLEEAGYDVHPLFVNESGRHWFTALNGYRFDKATRPNTARVWTNSDRVFSFMLRQMPFIREDFARLRTDKYPIRLWTVAVFLFGVLPLCWKRGLGRVVIGDENDTTVKVDYKGVTHHDGLYDQSRWFDERLTQLFADKGWGVEVLSLLRPCSEMLIEKMLGFRYPDLLRQQTSCHATHAEGERVRPCGKCEKCRRVVGMLLAMALDPRELEYSDEQIRKAIDDLAAYGVAQDPVDAAHLAYLLGRAGYLPPSSTWGKTAKEAPEVEKLRFDDVRAPLTVFPEDMRGRVLPLMLRDAPAVRKLGDGWIPYQVLHQPEPTKNEPGHPLRDGQYPWRYGELTYKQAERRLHEVDVAILPVGAIEQHGPHLPLDVDAHDAAWQAEQVAAACSDPKPLVLPSLPYGVSMHHDSFRGTISIEPETMTRLIYEVGMAAAKNGVKKLVVLNGHGGNAPALHVAGQMINRDSGIFVCVDSGESADGEIAGVAETAEDTHAGEIETSTSLSNRPHLVDMSHAAEAIPRYPSRYLESDSAVGVQWFAATRLISPSGVLGDPTRATREKGDAIWSITIRHLVALVEFLKRTPLEEIHRRQE